MRRADFRYAGECRRATQSAGDHQSICGCAYKDAVSEALGKRSIAWSNEHTTADNKAYLRALPAHIPLHLGDLRVMLVHGSPRRINEYLFAERPDSSLERLLGTVEADMLVCGHTHLPYHRVLPSGRHVVNAGSVGKPKDGDLQKKPGDNRECLPASVTRT